MNRISGYLSWRKNLEIKRIEICGGIASGKTTLAKLIARYRFPLLLENFRKNPFWRLFYCNPKEYAFATELTFFLQHYSQINEQLRHPQRFVSDFSTVQDAAYADVNLKRSDRVAFMGVYTHLTRRLPPPSLLIRLRCSADEELRRIRARARPEEAPIQVKYLRAINAAIQLRTLQREKEVPILEIDSDELDFAHDARAKRAVVELALNKLTR